MLSIIQCILLAISIKLCEQSYSENIEYATIKLRCHFDSFGSGRFGCRAANLSSLSRRTFIKAIDILSNSSHKSKSRSNNDVNTFYAYNANITFIPKQIGEHFPNLNNFIITKTGLQYIEWRDFKNMKHLVVLMLNENKIVSISQCAFYYLENLESINLDGNKIQALHEKTFSGLPNLKNFSANNNNIMHLDADIFRENRNLEKMLLNHNQLEIIEINFHGMSIKKVDFRFNKCIDMKFICCAHESFKNFTDHIKNNCGGPDFC